MADPTVPVLIPADTYPASGPAGAAVIYWLLDPTGPTFTEWFRDPRTVGNDVERLPGPYSQGALADGVPAWAMKSDTADQGGWLVPNGGPMTQLFTQTLHSGGGHLRAPGDGYLYAWDIDGTDRRPFRYLDGTVDHEFDYAEAGVPSDLRTSWFDVHVASNIMWFGQFADHLVEINLTDESSTDHGSAATLWPDLLDTGTSLRWWDVTVRGDELAVALRRFGSSADQVVVMARVALSDLSLIDFTTFPNNFDPHFIQPMMFDTENDGWWLCDFDQTVVAPPFLPDIYFCDVATYTTRLVATMPSGDAHGVYVGRLVIARRTFEVDPLSFLAIPP